MRPVPAAAAAEPRPSRLEALQGIAPYAALGLVLVLLWGIVLGFAALQKQRLLDETRRQLETTARASAEQTAGVLRDAETALHVIDLWLQELAPGTAAPDEARLTALIDTLRIPSRGMVDVVFATPQGALQRLPSAPALAELGAQPPIQALLRPDNDAGLALGAPVKLRPTGPRVLPLAIRLRRPVGTLVLALALIDLEQLGRVHLTLAREPAGSVGMIRSDGLVLSRVPEVQGLVGRNAFEGEGAPERRRQLSRDSGSYLSDANFTDGVPRLVAFQRLDGMPVMMIVSQGVDAALETYRERRGWVLLTCAVISALALAITWVLAQAQRRTRLSEAELRATVDASPLGLFRTDAAGELTEANETYLRIHGLTRDQLHWGWLTLLPEAERDGERRTWQEVVTQGGSLDTVRQYTRPDGRQVMLAVRTAPLRVDGRIVGQAGTVEDVTEQLAHERAQRTLTSIFDATPDYIVQSDIEGRMLYMNPAARERLGLSPQAALTGLTFEHFHPPAFVRRLREEAVPAAAANGHWFGRGVAYDAARREVPIDEMLLVHRGRDGRIETVSAILRDVSAEIEARHQLERSEAIMAAVAQSHSAMISVVDRAQCFLFMNRACERGFGVQREHWIGRPIRELLGEADYRRSQPLIEAALAGRRTAIQKTYEHRTDRHIFNVQYLPLLRDDGAIEGVIGIADDITDSKREESRLRDASQTDALTQLLNRRGFERRADEHIARARQDNGLLALLYLDLDHFKPVNDEHGHPVGDALLKAVAGRMRNALRPSDVLARLGGDEFAVLLPELREAADAQRIARKLVRVMAEPFLIQERVLRLGASVGVALARGSAAALDTLVADADAQLYAAKRGGRGRASGGPDTE